MVIGNGDIASVLKDREDVLFFASGVSNSSLKQHDSKERNREIMLLAKMPSDLHIVYFSTLSIYYKKSPYVEHKTFCEAFIKKNFDSYTIVRIGNITWGKNPNTLLNYLKAHPEAERRDEIRYLIDKEEFLHWMDKIRVGEKDIMNITGRMVNVKDL